jgi:LacI family transcriptional regulator
VDVLNRFHEPNAMAGLVSVHLKVALLIETSNSYARGLLRGVVSFHKEHRAWSLYLSEHNRGDEPPRWLSEWNGHGIIARIENDAIARVLREVRIPVVDVSAARLIPEIPWLETDDALIARLAAEHLLERGFRHFAFSGIQHFNWSNWREEAFAAEVRAAGGDCFVYRPSREFLDDDEGQVDDLATWVASLPKPVGVMACYDLRGVQILNACRSIGVAVPDEVAVIGVDNDDLLCEVSYPPLSSVIPNTQRTGYEAAKLLDQMMQGKLPRQAMHLVPPSGVATRQSTDVLAIDDRNVALGVHFIRQHACEGIKVTDVLKAVPHSRTLLEQGFKKYLGRTPHQEIMRIRLNRVRELLTETDLSLEGIAERTGFSHVEYLSVAFRREIGVPPSQYRLSQRPRLRRGSGMGAVEEL